MVITVGEIYELANYNKKKVIVVSTNSDGILVQLLDHIGYVSPTSKTYLGRGDIVRVTIDELVLKNEIVGDNEDLVKYLRKVDEVI